MICQPSDNSTPPQPLSLDLLTQVLEGISAPLFVKDERHRWVYLNQAFCDFSGYCKEDLLGKSDYDFFPKEQADVFRRHDNQVFSSGEASVDVENLTGADKRLSVISTRKSILKDNDGNRFLLGVISNLSQSARRERHQEQVAQILKRLVLGAPSEEILQVVLRVAEEALPGVIATILLLDQDTQKLYPPIESALPAEFCNAINGTPARLGMGSCGEAVYLGQQVIVQDISSHQNWYRVKDLAQKYDLQACWSQPVFDFSGTAIGSFALYFHHSAQPDPFELEVLTTLAQLTTIALEYHRIEQESQNLRLLMSNMINAMPSLLIAVDCHGRVLQWNGFAESMTGITASDAYGKELTAVLALSPEQLEDISQAIDERRSLNWARINHPWAGQDHWLDLTLYPISRGQCFGSVIRIDDVTNQVRLGQMMVQSEKINSLGGLAAGMAHEINNPLAGILQNIQVMQSRLRKGIKKNSVIAEACGCTIEQIECYMEERKIFALVESIVKAGGRASDIVNNMLSFGKKEATETCYRSIPEMMDNTIDLLDTDYNQSQRYDFRNVKILRNYSNNLPEIPCDGNEIQQVFFNLLKNAAQSLSAQGCASPQISVRIGADDSWLKIDIEDNGLGIEPAILQRIFDPFYTTKPVGSGVGLGLSVAHFIVTVTHQGRMSVVSQPGQGAQFLIELPLSRL